MNARPLFATFGVRATLAQRTAVAGLQQGIRHASQASLPPDSLTPPLPLLCDSPRPSPCQAREHAANGNFSAAATLAAWSGDVGAALRLLADRGELTAHWVAAAPAAGLDTWRAVARAYAAQLEAGGDPHGAATQLLAVGDAAEAVEVLSSAGLLLDALVLCRRVLRARGGRGL